MKNAAILVIDDYPDVRKALGRALESVGYTVFLAASGEEALTILEEKQLDAVVMDLHMPVMSGQTLFHVIIGKWPELKAKVLIMTGDARAEEKETWLNYRCMPTTPDFATRFTTMMIPVKCALLPKCGWRQINTIA